MGKLSDKPQTTTINDSDTLLLLREAATYQITSSNLKSQYGIDGFTYQNIKEITGSADFTLDTTYKGNQYIKVNTSGVIVITVPLEGSVSIPVGTELTFFNNTTNYVSFSAQSGVTMPVSGLTASLDNSQGAWCKLVKYANDEWHLFGELEAQVQMGKLSDKPQVTPSNNDSLVITQQGLTKRVVVQTFLSTFGLDNASDTDLLIPIGDTSLQLAGSGQVYSSIQSASALTITIPLNSATEIQEGSKFTFFNKSGVAVTFVPQSGVTVTSVNSDLTLNDYVGSWCTLEKVGADTWELFGDLLDNTVPISNQDDLPAAVGGVITLEAKSYRIIGAVTLSGVRVDMVDGSSLIGNFGATDGFVLTSGAYIANVSDSAAVLTIGNMTLFSLSVTSIVDIDTANKFSMRNVLVSDNEGTAASISVDTVDDIRIDSCDFSPLTAGDGVLFDGANTNLIYRGNLMEAQTAGTYVDLASATFDAVIITSNIINIDAVSDTGISGLATSGNINVGGNGLINDNVFIGSGTSLNNISNTDARWLVQDNT